ncbi:polyketide synthase family protein [Cylindrospermum stagnale PCC 7417]|uniref:Polyketide synthase family protein n=1 Tax=Cylindrospermum stagnale PCC 7417 TaxID=56107 RepID=K9WRK1_9NOST|nr:type I polyketide synthase [Cylindrospermum stagnale]AFZ22409.1 polyketide synthase family protein [Cylindrospermum stagnale PCC 7417]
MNKFEYNSNLPSALENSDFVIQQLESQLDKLEKYQTEPIAIIGMSCRFPGANDPESFWKLLRSGTNSATEIPEARWALNNYYDPDPSVTGKMPLRYGYFLTDIDQFDPDFFRISPREAGAIDPQHRLLLEVSWEALERAGYVPDRLAGSPTGVFIGLTSEDYNDVVQKRPFELNKQHELFFVTGVKSYAASGRISYTWGLTGPALTIDTACSASSVAIHQACTSLRQRECEMALAGGVNLTLDPTVHLYTYKGRILTLNSHCKVFDASADGYVRAEGCGIVVLKRLSDAIADRDNILAVIRGSGVNQDGASYSFSAPNGESQQALLRRVLAQAKVNPAEVSYFEAHGTGTAIGDATELTTVEQVFGPSHSKESPILVGSCKANIGHPEPASGIASLIKLVLSLQNQEIAPQINIKKINPCLDWEKTSVQIPTQLTPWTSSQRRMAALNCFGISGTNSCMLVQEAPELESVNSEWERPEHILVISAKTSVALKQLVELYLQHLSNHPEQALTDICFTANTGRLHLHHRLSIVGASAEEIKGKLAAFHQNEEAVGFSSGEINNSEPAKIAFLFTGQGSQYVEMGRQLYETQPTFRKALERCNEILQPYLEKSLLEVIYPRPGENSPLDETAYTQPCLFALEYALYCLWQSWGITPSAVMGHSVGEYIAACVAGVFSLEDALKLIVARGKLIQQLPKGGMMVALMANQQQVTAVIEESAAKVVIAAINSPESTVISGDEQAVKAVVARFEIEGIKSKQLQVSHAFHSPLMEPIIAEFKQVAREISYSPPKISMISNLTGEAVTHELTTPEYWCRHILSPVNFLAGINTLHSLGYEVFLECGSKPILLGTGRQCLPEGFGTWLPSLYPGKNDWQVLLQSLGQLYVGGAKVDWAGFDKDYLRRRVVLPTYPFQRQRYWLETEKDNDHPTTSVQLVTQVKQNQVDSKKGNKMHSQKLVKLLEQQRLQIIELLLEDTEQQSELRDKSTQINEQQYFKQSEESIPERYPNKVFTQANILQQLKVDAGNRRSILINYLQTQIAKILGRSPNQLRVDNTLTELGLESLSAIEFREKIKQELDIDVHGKNLLQGISIIRLTDEILDELSQKILSN